MKRKESGTMKKQLQAVQKRSTAKKDSIESAQSKESSGLQSSHSEDSESDSSQSDTPILTNKISMTASELDRRFDAGESVFDLGFDPAKAQRPGLQIKRVNVDLPSHVIAALDRRATEIGITRQALIKMILFQAVKDKHGA
jgi:hypothetical protein